MKKPVQIALVALSVMLLGTTVINYQKYQKASSNYSDMRTEEETTRNRYGRAINEIATIQDSLNTIVLGDEAARLISKDLESEQRLSQTGGDAALARIAVLKAGIERTKNKIQELDASLKRNGVRIAGLQKMIANLRKTVAEKEQLVAQLKSQVDGLQTQVSGLATEVQQNQDTIRAQVQTIEDKRRELGTIYYLVGTKKDLTTSGVIVAKGGVLGLGKTLKPTGRVNESMFTALDTDQESVIHIPSAKAQVLSAQPVSSYELDVVGGQMELRILNSKEFRTVKHLVIMTA